MKRNGNVFLDAMFRRPEMNRFDLSHEVKFSFNPGFAVPTCIQECLPGDVWDLAATDFMRFLPLKTPVMHRYRGAKHWFFVPNRILWEDFPEWIFDADSSDQLPYVIIDDVVPVGSLADYMGIPPGDYSNIQIDGAGYKVNLLPFAAYVKIHDEFYKQQFIQTPDFADIVPGDNTTAWLDFLLSPPLQAAWEKDYFTTCLPFPQDSATGVQIPLTFQEDIPVEVTTTSHNTTNWINPDGSNAGLGNINIQPGPVPFGTSTFDNDDEVIRFDPRGSLVVDVQSDAALITDLRRAFRLQEFLEKIITGGKRYIESLMTIFGVRSSDARLQRPEYITGDYFNITISEVLATTQSTDENQALGSMGGHAITVNGSEANKYRCEEHGWLLCITTVRPDTSYQDGLARHFTRQFPLDFALPDFALIGEQEVYRKEIQSELGTGVDPNAVFGYQKRYAEYMYAPSRVAGEMRTSLATWHSGRVFDDPDSPPALNEDFIICDPRYDMFAVTDGGEDHIIAQSINHLSVLRKLPRYAIPTI